MTKIIIIGGKGTAVVVAEQIWDARTRFNAPVEFLGFAFDDPAFGPEINGFPVLCKTHEVKARYGSYADVKFIFQLYRSDKIVERVKLRDSYGIPAERFCTFVHPAAYVARSARLGNGCVVCSNTAINPNVVISGFNTFNIGCLVGHDSRTGPNCFFAGHSCIGSNVTIDECTFVGLNASVKNFVHVGHTCLVGMAANVVSDVAPNVTVIGNPARPIAGRPVKEAQPVAQVSG
jgi:sugar O-acyltransferase (sialic acid O-acetyltransferase NeuD family)